VQTHETATLHTTYLHFQSLSYGRNKIVLTRYIYPKYGEVLAVRNTVWKNESALIRVIQGTNSTIDTYCHPLTFPSFVVLTRPRLLHGNRVVTSSKMLMYY